MITINQTPLTRDPIFLKWAGGKRKLLPQFSKHFPKRAKRFIDLTCGAGAVPLCWADRWREIILGDYSVPLMEVYKAVKDRPEKTIREIAAWANEYEAQQGFAARNDWYIETRTKMNAEIDEQRFDPALLITLNRLCYNGLWRFNKKGHFNAPFNVTEKFPLDHVSDRVRTTARILQKNVELLPASDFDAFDDVRPGDVFYFDPPHYDAFAGFTGDGFGESDQIRLQAAAQVISEKAAVFVSNSNAEFVRNLYRDFDIVEILSPRVINCQAKGRGEVVELLMHRKLS